MRSWITVGERGAGKRGGACLEEHAGELPRERWLLCRDLEVERLAHLVLGLGGAQLLPGQEREGVVSGEVAQVSTMQRRWFASRPGLRCGCGVRQGPDRE